MISNLPPILRVTHLAELLDLTPNGVRALIARGELPATKLGKQWIVRREVLISRLMAGEKRQRAATDPATVLAALPPRRRRSR
ncbi:MAG: excisionase family DNA binding protein [Pseudohongiellaceae bacterium]